MADPLADLPHGPSFRFVDDLVDLAPGKSGGGRYHVRGDEAFLEGHFPGQPMMPGVILIEAIAQLAGVVAQSDPEITALTDLRLTAVRQAKILGSAAPGETLELSVSIDARMGPLIQASGQITVGETLILKTGVVLSGTEAS